MLAQAARQPFDLATMLLPVLPWWELLIRGIIVYVFLLFLIRLTGRRQTGMLTPFDFILLLILSNTVQNAMNGGDNSLGGGLFLGRIGVAVFGAGSAGGGEDLLHEGFEFLDALVDGLAALPGALDPARQHGVLDRADAGILPNVQLYLGERDGLDGRFDGSENGHWRGLMFCARRDWRVVPCLYFRGGCR